MFCFTEVIIGGEGALPYKQTNIPVTSVKNSISQYIQNMLVKGIITVNSCSKRTQPQINTHLMQRARKRAHLCAMLRPASKKQTRTISKRHILVLESKLSFPSFELKNKIRILKHSHQDEWHFTVKGKTELFTCPVHWIELRPANTRYLTQDSEHVLWQHCLLLFYRGC